MYPYLKDIARHIHRLGYFIFHIDSGNVLFDFCNVLKYTIRYFVLHF